MATGALPSAGSQQQGAAQREAGVTAGSPHRCPEHGALRCFPGSKSCEQSGVQILRSGFQPHSENLPVRGTATKKIMLFLNPRPGLIFQEARLKAQKSSISGSRS